MEKRTSSGCPLSYFAALASGVQWRATENTGRMVLLRHQAGVRDARRSILPDMVMYEAGVSCSAGHDARIPLRSGNRHGNITVCLFVAKGLKIPSRQTATGTFHTDQRNVFSGVGESLRGGGDSFYKKRPHPLSMKPLQQRRTNLRGRLYRLRPWQGCPRSWPAQRGCAWRGGPGRSR